MIEALGVSKRFRHIEALRLVDLHVASGTVCGVMGPNGCGKTTLIKSILGLVIPDGGTIRVCGDRVDARGVHREHIGYLPQNPDFPANLTMKELFTLVEDIREKPGVRREELISLFELGGSLSRPMGVLSGGTKQKVATVLAFMFDQPVLILDEPSVGLDPVASVRLKGLIKEAAKAGKSVLLVSHIMSEAEQLVSEMNFLLDGEVRFSGSIESICAQAGASSLENAVIKLMGGNGMSHQGSSDARSQSV